MECVDTITMMVFKKIILEVYKNFHKKFGLSGCSLRKRRRRMRKGKKKEGKKEEEEERKRKKEEKKRVLE